MIKKFLKIFLSAIFLTLALANTNVFAADNTISLQDKSKNKVVDFNSNAPIIPYKAIKAIYKKNNIKLKESDIPTIKEFNKIINKKLKVSKNNPTQIINLGNGFSVVAKVWEEPNFTKPISNSKFLTTNLPILASSTTYNKTAKGSFTVRTLGVDQFRITVSCNFDYTGKKITSYQKPPSASAEAWLGWTGEITNKTVKDIDSTAKDAIADANYKYIKLIGNYAGHIELRFTATGNYYMHDTYIGSSKYN